MSKSEKDELLEEIVALEKRIDTRKEKSTEERDQLAHLSKKRTEIHKALQDIQKLYDVAASDVLHKERDLRDTTTILKSDQAALERRQRELARLLDAEKINAEYMSLVESFRESCLEAPWRAENRTDGIGAMPHQIDGAIHLAVAKQALLGDKMGLGKSLTSLIWADFIEARKVIVICPSDTMGNFVREINMWTPHRTPILVGKMPKGQRDFLLPQMKNFPEFMLVINYEAWRKDDQLIKDLNALQADTLILDEAHLAKNMDTVTCQGVMSIRFAGNVCPSCTTPVVKFDNNYVNGVCQSCGYDGESTEFSSIKNVLPMTGTPVLNRPDELFPQLKLIDPQNFQTLYNFRRDFCIVTGGGKWIWRMNAETELIRKIGPRYLARDRSSTGVKIPPSLPVDHVISKEEMLERYPAQGKAYEQARKFAQLVFDPDQELAMSMTIKLEVLLRLRQVLTWPAGIELKDKSVDDKTGAVTIRSLGHLDIRESIKVDKAEEIIRDCWESGERVVLFSQFSDVLVELERRLGNKAVVYKGGMTEYAKQAIQLDFDAKTMPITPRWNAVLANYRTGGQGLNFTGASQMVILDREWNPGKEGQAIGRIDRLGQTKETTVHTVMVENTVDTWMAGLISEKADMIAGFESEQSFYQKAFDALRNGEM